MVYSSASDYMFCSEFWKPIPPNEPFRVVLGNVRDKLYNTREYMREVLAFGKSDIAEEDIFTSVDEVYILLDDLLILICACQYIYLDMFILFKLLVS